MYRVGQNCIYTPYVADNPCGEYCIYGVYIRLWPTLLMQQALQGNMGDTAAEFLTGFDFSLEFQPILAMFSTK